MSRTDIYPPVQTTFYGEHKEALETWDYLWKRWNPVRHYSTQQMSVRHSTARRGVATVGYWNSAEQGELPENPFTFERTRQDAPFGVLKYQNGNNRSEQTGFFSVAFLAIPQPSAISSIRKSNLLNRVKQKLSEKIRDSDVNLAVTYAERERTFRMLTGQIGRLRKAFSAARQGKWSDAASALGVPLRGTNSSRRRSTANGWLELQYGWLPLLSDIHGTALLIEKQARDRHFVKVSAGSRINETSSTKVLSGNFVDTTLFSNVHQVTARCKMRSANLSLATLKELGFTNPLLVAWELVPFSFVIDWALPISSFISQLDASLGWTFVNGSYTEFSEDLAVTMRASARPAGFVYHFCDVSSRIERISVNRVGLGSFGSLLTLPYVKDPATMTHLANALALLNSKR